MDEAGQEPRQGTFRQLVHETLQLTLLTNREAILRGVLGATARLTGCRAVSLYRYGEGGFRRVLMHGLAPYSAEAVVRSRPGGFLGRAVEARQTVLQPTTASSHGQELIAKGLRSMAATPMLVQGRVVGALVTYYDRPVDEQDPDLVVTLQLLANHAGAVLQQVALLEGERERSRFFREMATLQQRIVASLRLEDVLRNALRGLQHLSHPDGVLLVFVEPERPRVHIGRAGGADEPRLRSYDLRKRHLRLLEAWQASAGSHTGACWLEAEKLPAPFRFLARILPKGARGLLVAPFRCNVGSSGGWLVLWKTEAPEEAPREPLDALAMWAGVVAQALTNALLYRRLQDAATTDALTGLPNHRAFQEWVDRTWEASRRNRRPLAILFGDLDHFKQVNDRFGHRVGDEVLRVVAGRLLRGLRAEDFLARYGGEEFVLLLPGTPGEEALTIADRLRRSLAEMPCRTTAGLVRITISFGVTSLIPDAPDPMPALELADRALYRAKAGGRNRCCLIREGGFTERELPLLHPTTP